jgi:hypothetical protein
LVGRIARVALGVALLLLAGGSAVLLPFAALTTAYVYFDVRVRFELEGSAEREPDVLDAESELAF